MVYQSLGPCSGVNVRDVQCKKPRVATFSVFTKKPLRLVARLARPRLFTLHKAAILQPIAPSTSAHMDRSDAGGTGLDDAEPIARPLRPLHPLHSRWSAPWGLCGHCGTRGRRGESDRGSTGLNWSDPRSRHLLPEPNQRTACAACTGSPVGEGQVKLHEHGRLTRGGGAGMMR